MFGQSAFVALFVGICLVQSGGANASTDEHYRICTALLMDNKTVLITQPFMNVEVRENLEDKLALWLERRHYAVKAVQCQLPVSREEVLERTRKAIEFNKKFNNIPQLFTYP